MKKIKHSGLALMMLFSLWACNLSYFEDAEIGDIVFDPSVALPLGTITYTVEELFQELNDAGADVGSNSENVVTLNYRNPLQSQSATSFVQLLDQNFANSLPLGASLSNPVASTALTSSRTFEFNFNQAGSEAYDSLTFSRGFFDFTLTSGFSSDVNYTITITSLERGNVPIVLNGSLSSNGEQASFREDLADVKGFLHLDASGSASRNSFLINISYDVIVDSGESVSSSDALSFTSSLQNMDFDVVYGDVGTQDLTVNFDIVSLSFFDRFNRGSLRFNDPTVDIEFDNSFGFPLGVSFPEFAGVDTNGGVTELTGAITQTQNIVPGVQINQQGQVIQTNLILTKDNSNIDDILSERPTKMIVDVNTETNPATTNAYNFVESSSILNIFVNIEIPLDLNLNELVAEDFVNFNNSEDLDEANRLLFRVFSENEMPMGGEVELQFVDRNGNVVYTIDQRPAFDAAPVGTDGRTSSVATNTTDIILEQTDIDAIQDATLVNVVAVLTTTDAASNAAYKFFDDYELVFRLAVQADVQVNSNGN